jgi:hypothetical protein
MAQKPLALAGQKLKRAAFGLLAALICLSVSGLAQFWPVQAALAQKPRAEARLDLSRIREGDILFQAIPSDQSLALSLATASRYTHCGLVLEDEGELMVFEAISSMSKTPLKSWLGRDPGFRVMRLKDWRLLTPKNIASMKTAFKEISGKGYDYLFQWSDDLIYCSELVWKIYQRGIGIELVPPKKMREYRLGEKEVDKLIKRRFGDNFSLEELAVSPADLMQSPYLLSVDLR